MTVELLKDENVLYTRDYCKGKKRSKGTITVTNKRLINCVESKYGEERCELKIEEVSGVKVSVSPVGKALFIVGTVLLLFLIFKEIYWWIDFAINGKYGGKYTYIVWEILNFHFLSYSLTLQYIRDILFLVAGIVCLIKCIIKIRGGFKVYILTDNAFTGLISASAALGKIRPLRLKTDQASAVEILGGLSSALSEAKEKKYSSALLL